MRRQTVVLAWVAAWTLTGLQSGCGSISAQWRSPLPTSEKVVLDVEDVRRNYLLHPPAGWDRRKPRPLVVALHGAFSSPALFEHRTHLSAVADREGFIVAYPAGRDLFGLLRHWNAVHGVGRAYDAGWKDALFVRRVLEDVRDRLPVDETRIYLVGHSNGAMLVHRLAGELYPALAAIATVAGTVGGRPEPSAEVKVATPPRGPVPVLLIHGEDDEIVPFGGGRPVNRRLTKRTDLSFAESVAFWREVNDATLREEIDVAGGRVLRCEYRGESPRQHVVACVVRDWAHLWPGPYSDITGKGPVLTEWDATEAVWRFFRQHPGRLGGQPLGGHDPE